MRLCLLLCVAVLGADVDIDAQTAATFFTLTAAGNTQGRATVRTSDYACQLQFSVEPPSSESSSSQSPATSGAEDAETLIGRLASPSKCARSVVTGKTFWQYKVCPGFVVTQSHEREEFVLGRFHKTSGNSQSFTNGDGCGAVSPPKPRTATVQYVCGPRLQVTHAEEVSTCSYSLVVTTPDGCSVPSMKTAPKRPSAPMAGTVDRPWTLEIEEGPGGTVACSAYVVDDLKVGGFTADVDALPLNRWASWRMAVWRTDEAATDGGTNTHSQPLTVTRHVLRAHNRQAVHPSLASMHRPDGVAVPATLSPSQAYTPQALEFMSVWVSDPESEHL